MKPEKLSTLRFDARESSYRRLGIGAKAAHLNRAVKTGLPVPNGIVLLDGAWKQLIELDVVAFENGAAHVTEPEFFLETFALTALHQPVAVRSAFSAEDGATTALAGHFNTHLNIQPDDHDTLIAAVLDVWQSGDSFDGDLRRDIIVMEMVDAKVAGVVFTERAHEDDLVNFTTGTGDKLVGGEVAGTQISLPRLRAGDRANGHPDYPFAARLQRMLRGVRNSLGWHGTDWDIEWADDGTTCYLLQARPITAAPRRNEAFTYANLREILPDPPSVYMTSVVAASAPGMFEWYRAFDQTLPDNRPMVEVMAGRPLFNLSLLSDMMRHWGLPTALVTSSIGGASVDGTGLQLGRFIRSWRPLLKLGWAQLRAVKSAEKQSAEIERRSTNLGNTFTDVSGTFVDLFTLFVTEMFNLTQAMSAPMLLLNRSGTLAEHSAGEQTAGGALFAALNDLKAKHGPFTTNQQSATNDQQLPTTTAFQNDWHALLARFGRRGIYESDIARPRYVEAPEPLIAALRAPAAPERPQQQSKRSGKAMLTAPVWAYCSRILQARERWRYASMGSYELVRSKLLALADQAVANGQLPDQEALWALTHAEMRALDDGAVYSAEFFTQRRADVVAQAAINVPDLVYRFDDLTQSADSANADPDKLRGVSLTTGEVEGQAWVLQTPEYSLPAGFSPDNTILVARSIDAGWIPLFAQVAAVIVEIGGDLSHGSIILREIGLPAITNVTGATTAIATGEQLRINAATGHIAKVARKVSGGEVV